MIYGQSSNNDKKYQENCYSQYLIRTIIMVNQERLTLKNGWWWLSTSCILAPPWLCGRSIYFRGPVLEGRKFWFTTQFKGHNVWVITKQKCFNVRFLQMGNVIMHGFRIIIRRLPLAVVGSASVHTSFIIFVWLHGSLHHAFDSSNSTVRLLWI